MTEVRTTPAPDLVCIGAQKAGTTWLYKNFWNADGIRLLDLKEVQYFNQLHIPAHAVWTQDHRTRNIRQSRLSAVDAAGEPDPQRLANLDLLARTDVDDNWYLSLFADLPPGVISGDFTPEYSLLPHEGIKHLLRVCNNPKIILILRDPLGRSWSQLRMKIKFDKLDRDGAMEVVESGDDDLYGRSDYAEILRKWRRHVPAERLFVGFHDDITARPAAVLEDVLNFLGVPFVRSAYPDLEARVFEGESMEMPAIMRERMMARLEPIYAALEGEFPERVAAWRVANTR